MAKLPVLEFLREGALLSFRGPVIPERWQLIPDLAMATHLVGQGTTTARPLGWPDLREKLDVDCGLTRLRSNIGETIRQLVFAYTPWEFEDLEAFIEWDLTSCVEYEIERERDEKLLPMLLEAYIAGGFPCGWSGDYPTGKLCVYWQAGGPKRREPATAHERRVAYQKQRLLERIRREW